MKPNDLRNQFKVIYYPQIDGKLKPLDNYWVIECLSVL